MNKWEINRTGIFNYWYYEDQTFDFAGGKMLLRGNNGAGKSVTMQSFLPVLLDGRTSPERLDPFGSRARRMEDYLLGEKEIAGHDERTGYLYMEFKRKETNQFMTIGIGLQARRGKQLNFWGFVLTDNRRIGVDLLLYKEERHEGKKQKIPLSKIELRNRIENGGHVTDTKKEYASLVNQYIFGYETIEEYEELIKLLIQLRSPKLSKEFRPTVIYEILEEALPPLSDEDLRHLSDTIEQMDQTKQQIEQLQRENNAINEINKAYTVYNERVFLDQAKGFIEAKKSHDKEKKEHQSVISEVKMVSQQIEKLDQELNDVAIDQEVYQNKEERLNQHEVWNLEKERTEKKEELQRISERLKKDELRLSQTRKKEYKTRETLDNVELSIRGYNEEFQDSLAELENDAIEAAFEQTHTIHQDDFKQNMDSDFSFGAWSTQTEQQLKHLEGITEKLRELDDLKQQFLKKDKQLGEINQTLDEKRNEEKDWQRLFEDEKQEHLNGIHQWLRKTEWLTVPEEIVMKVSRIMDRLYESTRYEQVRGLFRESLEDYQSEQKTELAYLHVQEKNFNQELLEKQNELSEWKNKKDPNPETPLETKEARQKLSDNGINHMPFYRTVEFREEIDYEKQKRIEAALLDSGLLDALVVDSEIEITHDRILKPNPQLMAYTLADVLKPDLDESSSLSSELVDNVLQSILIDDTDDQVLSITDDGSYAVGLMKGHAVTVSDVRFIGRNAREKYRKEQIEKVQFEISEIEKILSQVDQKKDIANQKIVAANERFEQFPDEENLNVVWENLKEVRFILDQLMDQVENLSQEVKQINDRARKMRYNIEQETKADQIKLHYDVYKNAIAAMRSYEKQLAEIRRIHIRFLNDIQRKLELDERVNELSDEMVQIQGDLNSFQSDKKRLVQNLKEIIEQMEQVGMTDIRHQIEEVQKSLKETRNQLTEKNKVLGEKSSSLSYMQKEVEEKSQKLVFWEHLVSAWNDSFKEEINRRLVSFEADQLEAIAHEIIQKFPDTRNRERAQLMSRLSRVVNEQRENLLDHPLTQKEALTSIPSWMDDFTGDPYVETWRNNRSRDIVEIQYQGQVVSTYTVQSELEKERTRQQVFLDEQDRELYEEILFQSVGNKLRTRINRAQQWIEEMKKLLESRHDSSGLTFSIQWKPRTAETEEELDTKDLVQLLRQDAQLLKEEDLDRITTHFRTRINRAKDLIDDNKEMQTLLQVLKQVLDYRRWFSFELSFQRIGDQRKRVLTNNQFDKFSGGEKARAMYIPLFIATYSRYQEASNDAPFIVSLDEAFAGVDEQNIRDLFEVVEELKFNYIINSQALWGDYDTISELAINELFRPQNADFVTVFRYLWDGKRRIRVHE